ncbi:Uncharacterized protein FWK35_00004591 [Aphis craccivora]|uniref:Uncharacterized protein n=1 Tax=Aphis craccivora TaxID=307492 RepID=A0A6G0ZL91_APHCR|nr:Uncharacterized protein FWK35_00004591 [Aphis craccivora]
MFIIYVDTNTLICDLYFFLCCNVVTICSNTLKSKIEITIINTLDGIMIYTLFSKLTNDVFFSSHWLLTLVVEPSERFMNRLGEGGSGIDFSNSQLKNAVLKNLDCIIDGEITECDEDEEHSDGDLSCFKYASIVKKIDLFNLIKKATNTTSRRLADYALYTQ